MGLELRQQQKLSQTLVMTPQLQQAIKLLQLNRLELAEELRTEMRENPTLEEDLSQNKPEKTNSLSSTEEPSSGKKELDVTERVEIGNKIGEIDWDSYANNFDSNFSFSREKPAADAPSQFDFISEKPGLLAHLQWQLAHCELDEDEWMIAIYVLGNLNRYGFLEVDLDGIQVGAECTADEAEYILEVVQDLDPAGIAARNVSESLYLQLERLGKKDSLAAEIVTEHMSLLETKDVKAISKATGKKRPEINRAIDFIIDNLTPFPGLPFSNDDTNYIVPDVYVRSIDGDLLVTLNTDEIPKLKLSDHYTKLAKSKEIPSESKKYIVEKMRSAEGFMKSIHQRHQTILKVMNSILKFQRDFFTHGTSHLRPLILRDIAEDIEMHESTVSRVTSNKYVHTPLGIYELKYFFTTAIASKDGSGDLAAEAIRLRIKKIIQEEDKAKPLSDNKLSELLAKENIKLARRTVAKYREQMQIPPVKIRRQKKR
ncbi:MAG: RNA polymerase factor sigma-54 [Desulfotalea sp.]